MSIPKLRSSGPFIFVLLTAFIGGCQTTSKGPQAQSTPKPPAGAPAIREIVADLKGADDALKNFRAAVTFTLESPKLKAVQRFTSGSIAFRRPGDLYIVGRNKLNVTLFKLTSQGPKFLIEFPTVQNTDERYYYSFEGEQFAKVPFSVAPADVVREMFAPVTWDNAAVQSARITAFDKDSGTADIDLPLADGLRRSLRVQGAPWVIVHSTLHAQDGAVLADTSMSGYGEFGGVRLPANVEANFPGEQTRLVFEMRNIQVNTNLPDSMFAITWRPGQ